MKKHFITLCAFVFCVALVLSGCATVSDVYKNGKTIYFDDVSYFQGQVALVGDYLYFGNGYADVGSESFDYSGSAKTGYLSRVNVSTNFEYKDKTEDKQNTSPKGVEKVNSKLIGYKSQNMFALGSYLYFTSANTHKTSSMENDYSQVSLFRVKFNGDGQEELGTFKHDDTSEFSVVKDGEDYYYLITAPNEDNDGRDVYSIKIGDTLGKPKKIVEKAKSVVLCDEDSTVKNVVYVVKAEDFTSETDCVKAVALDGKELDNLDNGIAGTSITLNGRVGDEVFYAYSQDGINEVYHRNIGGEFTSFSNGQVFHATTKINDVMKAEEGYVFTSDSSKSVMYKFSFDKDARLLLKKSDYTDILFVDGEYVYYSSSTSISRVNVQTTEKETLVSMTSIISGQVGYTGDYIYYYAQIENQEEDNKDTNYYMYRTDKQGNYTLVGKTK